MQYTLLRYPNICSKSSVEVSGGVGTDSITRWQGDRSNKYHLLHNLLHNSICHLPQPHYNKNHLSNTQTKKQNFLTENMVIEYKPNCTPTMVKITLLSNTDLGGWYTWCSPRQPIPQRGAKYGFILQNTYRWPSWRLRKRLWKCHCLNW